jgi:transcriptional regulator with XRE-family HTH domain
VAKDESFSKDQRAAIRAELKAWMELREKNEERRIVHAEVARRLARLSEHEAEKFGTTQQTISRFLNGGGIGWQLATRVALLLGYDGVDTLLRVKGLFPTATALDAREDDDSIADRKAAARVARERGLSDEAIRMVRSYAGDAATGRSFGDWYKEIERQHEALAKLRDEHERVGEIVENKKRRAKRKDDAA